MSKIDPDLLKRYAEGRCTAEETTRVEQWLDQDDEIADVQTFPGINKDELKEQIWNEVRPGSGPEKTPFRFPSYIYKVAVCLILASFAAYWALSYHRSDPTGHLATASANDKELSVPRGRKAQLTLSDGTVIFLNGDSKLKYPAVFTGRTRVVYLSGEAYFKVAKDPSKPFIIHTAYTDTRVLGTVFNVEAYPDEANTTLTVEEGRVQFSLIKDPDKKLLLTAGLQGIAGHGQTLQLQHVYAANYTAWKDEKLVIGNRSLKEISPLLEHWYNIRVSIKTPKLRDERFTGTYQRAAVNTIAQDISQAFHCQFRLKNNELEFY